MATFRKRNGKWQVQIRHAGHPPLTRTFTNKADASAWVSSQEHAYETGDIKRRDKTPRTVRELLDRYEAEVIPLKRTDSNERYMLRVLRRDAMSHKLLSYVTAQDVAKFRDARLQTAQNASVARQLSVLRHAFKIAENEWGWDTPSKELAKVRFPKISVKAVSRVSDEELERLLRAADDQSNRYVGFAVRLAVGTAMRRGELLALKWDDIDFSRRSILIRMSKNGHSRLIPITPEVASLLEGILDQSNCVVPISANSLRLGFERARAKASVSFRFHDLRHEAISRFFELGLTIPEVQLISGHRTLSQLGRYSHPDAARVAAKLGSFNNGAGYGVKRTGEDTPARDHDANRSS